MPCFAANSFRFCEWIFLYSGFRKSCESTVFLPPCCKEQGREGALQICFPGCFLSSLSAEHRRPFNVLCQGEEATRGKKIFSQSLHKAAFAACKTVCRLVLIVCRFVDSACKHKRLKIYQLAKNKAGSCRRFQKEISG